MHEESLVRSLLRQIQALCHEHQAVSVGQIVVSCGPLSGVEPTLLTMAFERLYPETLAGTPRLTIRNAELRIRCGQCGVESSLSAFEFRCPQCGNDQVTVTGGDSLMLVSVELLFPESGSRLSETS